MQFVVLHVQVTCKCCKWSFANSYVSTTYKEFADAHKAYMHLYRPPPHLSKRLIIRTLRCFLKHPTIQTYRRRMLQL